MSRGARAFLPLLAAAVLAAGWAAPAGADDDAGTGSVFSFGAGNRALGMGGAFVATADDASALAWNPGGLGLLQRAEGQVVQSAGLGLGFSEFYGSVVLPSWRFGTLGLMVRQFGVGGIEQRDDRNVLLSDDLTDSELELALGYGRALGPAWSLGGAVKLQHHSLAGFSGSGLGADLGAVVKPALALGVDAPWAQRLSLGLAVRNALQPQTRLDRDAAADPTALRAGLSYRVPLGAGWARAGADVSQARGEAARLHAGLELQPLAAAAVRVGADGGRLAAGASVSLADLSVDYAFRSNPLAEEHRVGLTLHFGSTLEARRTAARRAEDEALQKRLAEGFRQRQ
ncbi:MAG TPA: hypothetical protein VMS93_04370, partial [Candidatus Saccharimonadales bacterium]|nr:hypothetical protein [Candidatus Saccharimonadales bacterium]